MSKRRRSPPTTVQPPAPEPVNPKLPTAWRDPWSLAPIVGVLAVLFAARAAPLGFPVADDFDFLSHALLHPPVDWLDGGGGVYYWRPLARQLYYQLLGPLLLSWPLGVALIHAAILALTGLLLFRALRPAWPAPAAALAASFPLVLDASRQVVTWSSCAQDLLALLFGIAALHALSRGRLPLALAALLAALLCKETAIAFAPSLAFWPAHTMRVAGGSLEPADRNQRLRTLAGAIGVLCIWWVVHEWVSRRAHLLPPPHGAEGQPTAGPLAEGWFAVRGIWLDLWSVRDPSALHAPWVPWAALALVATGVTFGFATKRGRESLRAALPWLAWAAVWTGIAVLPLARFMPLWASYRSLIPAAGIGIALVSALRAAPPVWLAMIAIIRLAALLASPAPAPRISTTGTNVDFDFSRVATLQRLAHDVHETLIAAHPTLPHGARIARNQWPRMSLFAFREESAFHLWYRDTTLQVVGMADVLARPEQPLDVVIEFEPHQSPQLTLVNPAAIQAVLFAADSLNHGRCVQALAGLNGFEELQPDTSCAIFMSVVWTLRGGSLLCLRRVEEAERALRRAVRFYSQQTDAHRILAECYRLQGRRNEAMNELHEHLRYFPKDAAAQRALTQLSVLSPGP